jgi:hypothetical protein
MKVLREILGMVYGYKFFPLCPELTIKFCLFYPLFQDESMYFKML